MNLYATPAEITARVPAAVGSEALLLSLIELASREVDARCRNHFYPETATRDFTAARASELLIDSLLSLTSLATDDTGDYTYATTWAVGDYFLDPANTLPKTAIRPRPDGNYSFPTGHPRGVRVTGSWGYGDGRRAAPWDVTAITGTVATTSGTALTLNTAGTIAAGQTILVDAEQMYVSAVATTTATVIRGVNGTTAATHAAAIINTAAYPRMVKEAVIYIARALWESAAGEGLTSEKIGDYEYVRANLSTVTTREEQVLTRFLAPFTRVAV